MPLFLRNINKAFGEKQVLDGFSLDVSDGERVCILGPSGGGKSTLLHIIAGLLPPDSGEMESTYDRVAYVFQEYRLLPWLTAEENITAAAGCTREKARELLEAVELGAEAQTYPDKLSGGMKQRVNIARALAFDAELVLMDEPFRGLDAALRERVIQQVKFYCEGRTLILVTHDKVECELVGCTRVCDFS